jgi:hypothetical protein
MNAPYTIGQKVHIDTDNLDWGRVACDGEIVHPPHRGLALVYAASIRATILVPTTDMNILP